MSRIEISCRPFSCDISKCLPGGPEIIHGTKFPWTQKVLNHPETLIRPEWERGHVTPVPRRDWTPASSPRCVCTRVRVGSNFDQTLQEAGETPLPFSGWGPVTEFLNKVLTQSALVTLVEWSQHTQVCVSPTHKEHSRPRDSSSSLWSQKSLITHWKEYLLSWTEKKPQQLDSEMLTCTEEPTPPPLG